MSVCVCEWDAPRNETRTRAKEKEGRQAQRRCEFVDLLLLLLLLQQCETNRITIQFLFYFDCRVVAVNLSP